MGATLTITDSGPLDDGTLHSWCLTSIPAISNDCNGNGVLDRCEEDCNGNGITDACDIANAGRFEDSGQELGSFDSRSLSLEDLDGDGDLDVFVANQPTPWKAKQNHRANKGKPIYSNNLYENICAYIYIYIMDDYESR